VSLHEQLVDAACAGNTVAIKNLIAAGADPNYQNEQVNTILMWAVTHRHLDGARLLLASGADVNAQDVLGGTALMVGGLATYPVLTAQTPARRVIRPAKFPNVGLPYSPGIMVGDTLYLAGQLGRDPATTKIVPGGIEAETCMDFPDVVTVTACIVDFKDFDGYNKVYREFFPKDQPARATVGVASLNQGGRVELQMIAVKPK
jgi:2-iminobutanoate/2-iminopropanoate deaminase